MKRIYNSVFSLILLHTIILAFIPALTNAQIMFQRHYGGAGDDGGNAVIQTSDGGYLVAGLTDSWGAGSKDIYLIKTNEYGDTTWTKHYGGYNWDSPVSVLEGSDSFYYLSGNTSSQGSGASDVFLMKVSLNGDSVWLKTYGGSEDEDARDFVQCVDGGFMIAGTSCSFATGFSSAYAIRTDVNGDTLWTKTYEREWANYVFSIFQTDDNGFVIGGLTGSAGSSTFDCYVIRTNSAGDTLWTKTYGGTSRDDLACISKSMDGNYFLAGTTASVGAGGYDMYLIKIDTNGGVIWEKTYGGTANDYGYYCTASSFGAIIVGETASFGHGGSDAYMAAVNQNGDTLWTHVYGGANDDWVNCIQETNDGGFIMSGYYNFDVSSDLYLIKTRADGFAGIENNEMQEIVINVYPNPCSEILNISASILSESDVTVEIVNFQGQKVLSEQIDQTSNNLASLNVSVLPSGIYFLTILSGETQISKKIIIN